MHWQVGLENQRMYRQAYSIREDSALAVVRRSGLGAVAMDKAIRTGQPSVRTRLPRHAPGPGAHLHSWPGSIASNLVDVNRPSSNPIAERAVCNAVGV